MPHSPEQKTIEVQTAQAVAPAAICSAFVRPGGGKPIKRLSTFFWRRMECATCLRRYGDRNAKVVKAYHVATGVSLTFVPEFVDRHNPLTSAIAKAEAYAKATLAAYPGGLRRFKRLANAGLSHGDGSATPQAR